VFVLAYADAVMDRSPFIPGGTSPSDVEHREAALMECLGPDLFDPHKDIKHVTLGRSHFYG
jgi:hypothetical protein